MHFFTVLAGSYALLPLVISAPVAPSNSPLKPHMLRIENNSFIDLLERVPVHAPGDIEIRGTGSSAVPDGIIISQYKGDLIGKRGLGFSPLLNTIEVNQYKSDTLKEREE